MAERPRLYLRRGPDQNPSDPFVGCCYDAWQHIKNPRLIAYEIVSKVNSRQDVWDLVTQDPIKPVLDAWEFVWEPNDQDFNRAYGKAAMEAAIVATAKMAKVCWNDV